MRICIRMIVVIFAAAAMFFCGIPCHAEDAAMDALYDAAGDISIPPEAEQYLSDAGISADEPESLLTLSPAGMLRAVVSAAAEEAAAPLHSCGILLALTVLSTVLGSMNDAASHPAIKRLFEVICTLLCIGQAARPLCTCLIRTAEALSRGQVFMGSFVPVFAAFLAAGGAVAEGAAYQAFVLFLTETVMQLAAGILFPLLQMAAALGIVDAVNPALRLGSFVSGIRTAVTWILGFVTALFSALLSVRSFVASAADSLAAKSLRLIASNMIPIVGSAVSDAYGTVQGSIHLLRNGVGAVGILVILWLVLPPVISLILYRLIFWLMRLFADMAGAKPMAALFQNTQDVLTAAFAILICFALMLIFSSAIMLLLLGK